jgi:uncharacterized protein with HEPN domain
MREFRDRLQDTLDAIARIEVEQVEGKEALETNLLIQVWMVHHLLIIGEAVRATGPALRQPGEENSPEPAPYTDFLSLFR